MRGVTDNRLPSRPLGQSAWADSRSRWAGAPGALLLLFIDHDRLSCLELAPLDPDSQILEFPPVESMDFA